MAWIDAISDIVSRVSGIYAQHPNVGKALGSAAITIAIQHIARRR